MTRREKDWFPVDALALHDAYTSPQIPNVRRWSRRCFDRGGSTVDRVVPGFCRGMPPVAARWHDATTGACTVAELQTQRKKGTSHLRVVLVSEKRFVDAACADRVWDSVVARHAVMPLHGVDAQEVMRNEIVEGAFGCLWRLPRGDDASGASSSSDVSSSSGDSSSSSSDNDNDTDDDGDLDADDDLDADGAHGADSAHGEMDLDELSLEASVGASSPEEGSRLLDLFLRDGESATATLCPLVSPAPGALDEEEEEEEKEKRLDLGLGGVLSPIEDRGPVAWELDVFSQMVMDVFPDF